MNDVTREKERQVVRWVNYTPNAAARGLAAFALNQLTGNLAKTNSDINYNCLRFMTF